MNPHVKKALASVRECLARPNKSGLFHLSTAEQCERELVSLVEMTRRHKWRRQERLVVAALDELRARMVVEAFRETRFREIDRPVSHNSTFDVSVAAMFGGTGGHDDEW